MNRVAVAKSEERFPAYAHHKTPAGLDLNFIYRNVAARAVVELCCR